eukprot:9484789-Pyramimonas_sp.AAC.1
MGAGINPRGFSSSVPARVISRWRLGQMAPTMQPTNEKLKRQASPPPPLASLASPKSRGPCTGQRMTPTMSISPGLCSQS